MRRSFTGMASLILGTLPLTGTMAAGAFDGIYTGMQRQTNYTPAGGHCTNHDPPTSTRLVVADNVVKFHWARGMLEAPIGSDGSFSGSRPGWAGVRGSSGQAFTLAGRLSGGYLEADVGNTLCGVHLSLKKE